MRPRKVEADPPLRAPMRGEGGAHGFQSRARRPTIGRHKVRRRVHELASKGIDSYYEHVCVETERQRRPVTLICIREYILKQVNT